MNNRRLRRKPAPEPVAVSPDESSTSSRDLRRQCRDLDDQTSSIASQMRELEEFIVASPRLAKEHRLQTMDMVPPPDLAHGSETFADIGERLCHGRRQRIEQARQRHIAMFLGLLALVGAAAFWLVKFVF